MPPDDFQRAWQQQSSRTQVKVDAELLLQEVQRSEKDFQNTIYYRDTREIIVAILMIPVTIIMGYVIELPWTWYLGIPSSLWVAGFMFAYRIRNKQDSGEPDEPLLSSVKRSLNAQENQIWLLSNVLWWYILPPLCAMLPFFAQVTWQDAENLRDAMVRAPFFFLLASFVLAVFYFVYRVNIQCVEQQLKPRREELRKILNNFQDESEGELDVVAALANQPTPWRPTWPIFAAAGSSLAMGLVAMLLIVGTHSAFIDLPPNFQGPAGTALSNQIVDLRKKHGLVGLAAMVSEQGKPISVAAVGERKIDSGVLIETTDRWHLGGITKSVTATMIARLIESGTMQWSDTVGDAFPGENIHEQWRSVTLRQLLTDSAGAPAQFSRGINRQRPPFGPECTAARRKEVLKVLSEKPVSTPGKVYAYSNVGTTIAAAMVEKATNQSWSTLIEREVLQPLTLSSSGFGPPKSSDDLVEQPRGHRTILRGKVAVGDDNDNSPIMGPAATMHMSLQDLCAFATEHLRGHLGDGTLLSQESFVQLHKPARNRYACGWIKREPDASIPHTVYWHNGSNTLWYALVVFIPERGMVVAVTANDGDSVKAEEAAWEIVEQSVRYPKESPFAAIRWRADEPEVQLDDGWYKLLAIDEHSVEEILNFSRETEGTVWRKRFEEDLVELLSKMGSPPGDRVTLRIQSLDSNQTWEREGVPMTEENRDAIRNASRSP